MGKPVPFWQLYTDVYDCMRDRSAMDRLRDMVARRACIRDTHRLDDNEVIKLARCWLSEKDTFVSKKTLPEGQQVGKADAKTKDAAPKDAAPKDAAPKDELPEGEKAYELKSGVVLISKIEAKVKRIADSYYAKAKKKITVTSGTRSAKAQAKAMYGKLAAGGSMSIYKDKASAKEVKKAYSEGKKAEESKGQIVKRMAKVIEGQVKKGKYLSKHLRAGAIDVRSRDMSSKEKEYFKQAIKGVAKSFILEKKPPHWHLQF